MKGLGALGPFWPGRTDVQLCIYSYMLKNDISSEATEPISMKLGRKGLLLIQMKGLGALWSFWPGRRDVQLHIASHV